MQVVRGGVEIVAARRLVALAETAGIEHDDAPPGADQQRHNLAPGDPALGPARDQQHRIAAPGRHVVEARAVDLGDMVLELVGACRALSERARDEQGADRNCGSRLDEGDHCLTLPSGIASSSTSACVNVIVSNWRKYLCRSIARPSWFDGLTMRMRPSS